MLTVASGLALTVLTMSYQSAVPGTILMPLPAASPNAQCLQSSAIVLHTTVPHVSCRA